MLKTTELGELRPEHELILALSRPQLSSEDQHRIREFLTEKGEEIHWGEFIDQAARHMVLPLISRHLNTLRLTHSDSGKPLIPYRWIYHDAYEGSKRRNAALGKEYALVLRTLNEAGLPYLIRKGPVLGEHVYKDIAARRISNLDIFMARSDYPRFQEFATDLGYRMGELSKNGTSIVPFDRKTELYWKVNLTNTSLPYARLGDRDLVESYLLSSMFSLFQPMLGIRDDADEMLARSVPITLYGVQSRMLSPVDQVVDSCIQIHLRATLFYYIESNKDLLIRNYLDLAHLLQQAPPGFAAEFRETVDKYQIGRSVYYSMHFARLLYPEAVPVELMEAYRPDDIGYLEEYGGFDGVRFTWKNDFATRLFERTRTGEIEARSQVPGPRSFV